MYPDVRMNSYSETLTSNRDCCTMSAQRSDHRWQLKRDR